MRTIKFRGKRIETGEWVYGNYIEKIKPTEKEPVFWCCFIQDKAISMHEVDLKTVGQFTGLLDKNGKEIYEGDILDHVGYNVPKFVVFSNGSYCLSDGNSNLVMWIENTKHLTIVGNIHDNQDLLK